MPAVWRLVGPGGGRCAARAALLRAFDAELATLSSYRHVRLVRLLVPLGALDALTRIEMHRLIEGLWQASGFTALLVTHDVQEAVALADRVILIEDGRIALDEFVALPRPRSHGDPAFAALEKRILDRVLQKPASESVAPDASGRPWPGLAAGGLRWAI